MTIGSQRKAAISAPHRRGFLTGLAAVAATAAVGSVMLPDPALAAMGGERRLRLFNINTQESFSGVYWQDGKYLPDTMKRLAVLLRDHRAELVHSIDPKLFDLLASLSQRLGLDGQSYKVICGYRSAKTNELRHEESRGVAKQSYHIKGQAIDVSLEGRDLKGLYTNAVALGGGGVGLYRRSNFVHVDTGPVRTW